MRFFFLVLFLLQTAHAQITASAGASAEKREKSSGTVFLGYELFSTWVPSKKILSYNYLFNDKWSVGFEYAWSTIDAPVIGIDLGHITERRYSLLAQRYVGNSFYFAFGPYFYDIEAKAGSDILNNIGVPTVAEFGAEGVGIAMGIGNRWHWNNGFTLGFDWLRLNVPLRDTKIENSILKDISDEGDSDDIKLVVDAMSSVPTLVLFGVGIGYTF